MINASQSLIQLKRHVFAPAMNNVVQLTNHVIVRVLELEWTLYCDRNAFLFVINIIINFRIIIIISSLVCSVSNRIL